MELDATTSIILGLVLEVIGVILLVYDLIYGFKSNWKGHYAKIKLDNEVSFLNSEIHCINKLNQPPYTPSEIKNLTKEASDRHQPAIDRLKKELTHSNNHPTRAVLIGSIGIIVIIIGLGFQVKGTISSSDSMKKLEKRIETLEKKL